MTKTDESAPATVQSSEASPESNQQQPQEPSASAAQSSEASPESNQQQPQEPSASAVQSSEASPEPNQQQPPRLTHQRSSAPARRDAAPDLQRTPRLREGMVDETSVYRLIDIKDSLSTVELTLTTITVAVIVLKVSFSELATQIGSLLAGGDARTFLDVSVSAGFIAIVIATFQIPRHFTDALIYSNRDTMRVLFIVGAQPSFVAACFAKVVLRAMVKAVWRGLLVIALLYLLISEFAQLWVPTTRTYFLREVAEAVVAIGVFAIGVYLVVKRKAMAFYKNGMLD